MEKINLFVNTDFSIVGDKTDHIIEGYAAEFDKLSELYPYVDENGDFKLGYLMIPKDSFNNADFTDVTLNFNHDDDFLLARTRNNSLHLEFGTDDHPDGLWMSAKLNHSFLAEDIFENIRSGLLDKMSLSITFEDLNYGDGGLADDGKQILTIPPVKEVIDVSVVTKPQFEDTAISITNFFKAQYSSLKQKENNDKLLKLCKAVMNTKAL